MTYLRTDTADRLEQVTDTIRFGYRKPNEQIKAEEKKAKERQERAKRLAQLLEKQEKAAKEDAKAAFENEVVRVVAENTEVEIPDVMVENELENMVQDQAMRMQQSGIELDMYLNYIGQSMDEYKESMRPMARVRVKNNLVIEKITAELNPEVTDDEYNEEIEKMAKAYSMGVDEIKNALGDTSDYLKDSIKARKTVEYLAEKAVKTEPKKDEEKTEE